MLIDPNLFLYIQRIHTACLMHGDIISDLWHYLSAPKPFQHFCVHVRLLQAVGVLLAVQCRVLLSRLLSGGTGSQQLRSGAEQSNCRRRWPETTAGVGGEGWGENKSPVGGGNREAGIHPFRLTVIMCNLKTSMCWFRGWAPIALVLFNSNPSLLNSYKNPVFIIYLLASGVKLLEVSVLMLLDAPTGSFTQKPHKQETSRVVNRV